MFLQQKNNVPFDVRSLVEDVLNGRADDFMRRLQTLYANMDYEIAGDEEKYFHNTLFVIFMMIGTFVRVERYTNDGRLDMSVETDQYVYVFEFKLDRSADEALQQIEDKGYAAPFAMSGRKIFKIGVNFSTATRAIEKYIIA